MADTIAAEARQRLTAVDLFCGAGGLTVGLKSAGFDVRAGVELDTDAADTYSANHPEVNLLRQDIRQLSGSSIKNTIASLSVDLVAGCPPCQGFTSLTSKWRRYDARNSLVHEMARVVRELRPRAVMMENVPGLTGKGASDLSAFIETLERLGYDVNYEIVQTADYGTPQMRRRLVLFAGMGFRIDIPSASHSAYARSEKLPWVTVRTALKDTPAPSVFARGPLPQDCKLTDWNVVRRMSTANKSRLLYAVPGGDWRTVPEELRPKCHRGSYFGFRNVYGRMKWDAPSPTITSGCTTFSKGRFGHPEQERTISVYEAGLLQELPRNYKIRSSRIDRVCAMIGNALPCGFAHAMAREVYNRLQETGL